MNGHGVGFGSELLLGNKEVGAPRKSHNCAKPLVASWQQLNQSWTLDQYRGTKDTRIIAKS